MKSHPPLNVYWNPLVPVLFPLEVTTTEETSSLGAPGGVRGGEGCGVAPSPRCTLELIGSSALGVRIGVKVQVGTHPYVRYWPGQNEVVSQRPPKVRSHLGRIPHAGS